MTSVSLPPVLLIPAFLFLRFLFFFLFSFLRVNFCKLRIMVEAVNSYADRFFVNAFLLDGSAFLIDFTLPLYVQGLKSKVRVKKS